MSPAKAEHSGEGKKQSFWTTLPGLITAIAALLTAITGAYLALHPGGSGNDGGSGQPTITPAIIPPMSLVLNPWVSNDTVQPGGVTWITVVVHDQSDKEVPNATVKLSAGNGIFSSGKMSITGITNEDGVFSDKWRAPLGARGNEFIIDIDVSYPGSPKAEGYVAVNIAS